MESNTNLIKNRHIQGIPLDDHGEEQLMYQLFVDDTSLSLVATEENFKEAREVIVVYERISRARLNLEKSIIMPLEDDLYPDWFARIGCKVAQPGEV